MSPPVCICANHLALQRDARQSAHSSVGSLQAHFKADISETKKQQLGFESRNIQNYKTIFTRRCSSAEERLNPRPSPPSTITGPIDGRLSDHNGEDVGSKPTAGIPFNSPALQKLDSAKSATNPNPLRKEGCGELRFPFTYRGGAEEARGAHNSEDVGSKPTPGNIFVNVNVNVILYSADSKKTFQILFVRL